VKRVALLVAAAMCALAGCHGGSKQRFEPRPFDRAAWRSHPLERGPLVDDLLRRYLHAGMRRGRVLRLLGPPTTTFPGRPRYDVYDVGRYREQEGDELLIEYRGGRIARIEPPAGVPVGP
jgi:hypothetical protein